MSCDWRRALTVGCGKRDERSVVRLLCSSTKMDSSLSLILRSLQAVLLAIAIICFATGGNCWTTPKAPNDYCGDDNPAYDKSIRKWTAEGRNMGGLYVNLLCSCILFSINVFSIICLARGRKAVRPQCFGAHFCVYLGFFTGWFAWAYSPVDGAYSAHWLVSSIFYFLATAAYVADMVLEARAENREKKN